MSFALLTFLCSAGTFLMNAAVAQQEDNCDRRNGTIMQDQNIEPQLRSLVLSHLQIKRAFNEMLSVPHLTHEIAENAQKQGLKMRGHDVFIKNGFDTFQPSPYLVPLVWDIVWDLIIEGVIRPGRAATSKNLSRYAAFPAT